MLPADQPPQTMPSSPNPTQTLTRSEAANAGKNVTTHRSLRLFSIHSFALTAVRPLHGSIHIIITIAAVFTTLLLFLIAIITGIVDTAAGTFPLVGEVHKLPLCWLVVEERW